MWSESAHRALPRSRRGGSPRERQSLWARRFRMGYRPPIRAIGRPAAAGGTVCVNHHAGLAPNLLFGVITCSGIDLQIGEEGLQTSTTIMVLNAGD